MKTLLCIWLLWGCASTEPPVYEQTVGKVVKITPKLRDGQPNKVWVQLRCDNGRTMSFEADTSRQYFRKGQSVPVTTKLK